VIEEIEAHRTGATWQFDVTLSHGDTEWDDYADGWRVLDMQGNELAMRVLHHPHVNEQPFTRSLSDVRLPEGATKVRIEARDKTGGWSGEPVIYTLP
jgi:hypothetical protein